MIFLAIAHQMTLFNEKLQMCRQLTNELTVWIIKILIYLILTILSAICLEHILRNHYSI